MRACVCACMPYDARRLGACLLGATASFPTALTMPSRPPLPPTHVCVCGAVRFKDKGREKQRQAGLKQRQKERLETAAGRKDAQRKAAHRGDGVPNQGVGV